MNSLWIVFFALSSLTACTPTLGEFESKGSLPVEPISYVNYISPYPDGFDFSGDYSYEEILAAFEEGFYEHSGVEKDGTDTALLFDAFGGHVSQEQLEQLDSWIVTGNHSETDESGRLIFSFQENLWGDFGEELFEVEHYEYEGDTAYVELWWAAKQSDQLAFPRVVYVYYAGPVDRMDEIPYY